MLGTFPAKPSVQRAARSSVANVAEYGRAFEGGSGRDIRMEGFVRVGPGSPGSSPGGSVRTPVDPKRVAFPVVLIVLVLILAS